MSINPKRWTDRFPERLPSGLAVGWFAAGLLSVFAFFSRGHKGDLNYWWTWLEQLQSGGYAQLDANYPPILLHWLALGGVILDAVGLGSGNPLIVKIWVQLPVWLAWMLLLYQVARTLAERGITPMTSGIFWVVALNPAILIDGPVWGQVDFLPWIPLSLGLLAYARGKDWQGPMWFCVAMAVKFQAIVLAPVFAALFLRSVHSDRKVLRAALPAAVGAILLAFLPFILVGRGWAQAGEAFWKNLGRYPHATLNAANLWKLLTPFGAYGSEPLPGFEGISWMTPSKLGLALFGCISIVVFVATFRKSANVWALGTLAMFGFFAFSSAMHERYLFMAVPFAAMWAASEDRGKPWLVVSTALVSLNIAFRLFPTDFHEWMGVSAIVVLAVPFLVLQSFDVRLPQALWTFWDARPWRTIALAAGLPFIVWTVELAYTSASAKLDLDVGDRRSMARWQPVSAKQDWGVPRWRHRPWHQPVKYSSSSVTTGIKTHAKSDFRYQVPQGRYLVSGLAGAEKEANDNADMRFEIKFDGVSLWTSPTVERKSAAAPFEVVIVGPGVLELHVDPLDSNNGDHALWGDTFIKRLE